MLVKEAPDICSHPITAECEAILVVPQQAPSGA